MSELNTREETLDESQSLTLITTMINKARNAYYDSGLASIMWGAVITICSLVKLAEIHFGFRLPVDIFWLTFVAVIPQVFISIREKKNRKIRSYDDSAMDNIWLAFGISIFLLIHINISVFEGVAHLRADYFASSGTESSFHYGEYVFSYFLMLYGMPTFITGAMYRFKPMLFGGIFCWVCSIVAVYSPIRIDLLLTAFSSLFAWFIPGLILRRRFIQAKRKLNQEDV